MGNLIEPEDDWGRSMADALERTWRDGKLPEYITLLRTEDGLVEFADALEGMLHADKMPNALASLRAERGAL